MAKLSYETNTSHQMPPAYADAEIQWSFIEKGMGEIMKASPPRVESFPKYTSLYTVVYNLCLSSRMPMGMRLAEDDMYNRLIRYFSAYLKDLKEQSDNLQDEELLRYYAREWDRYTTGANYIDRVFAFLNRHWVELNRALGRKGIYPVYTLALSLWKSNFFLGVQGEHKKLTSVILKLIERERDGEAIDQGLVKKIVDSFVSLGLDEKNINKTSFDVYTKHLESPLLEATKRYYEQESEAFSTEISVSDFKKKAKERVGEEADRVDRYLNAETKDRLVSVCGDCYSTTFDSVASV